MTINQLIYALALSRHGSFRRAAAEVAISQPGLSLQVQKLEDEVGFKLFNRASSPIEVTEDGKLFLAKAQEIVNGVKQLENFTEEIKEDFTGRLVVGIIPTLAPFLVPLFIESMERDYPRLQVVIREQITEKIIHNVRSGELDVGIISTPVRSYGIKTIPLFYERFYVYTSGEQTGKTEFSLADITLDKLWMLEEGNCFQDQVNNFCDLKSIREGRKFIYQSNSIDALIRIVDTKGGMTILPELTSLCLSVEQEENLKSIKGKPKAREIGLIVTNKYDKQRYIKVLAEYIQMNIPNHMLAGDEYEIVDPNIQVR